MDNLKGMKIYGLCLERLAFQIKNADKRMSQTGERKVILESYGTSDVDEIIELLELEDLGERNKESLDKKLEDLASDASLFMRKVVNFEYEKETGDLVLYTSKKMRCV